MRKPANPADVHSERDQFIKSIFSTVAPHIDSLTTIFSLGFCHLWRKKVVELADLQRGEHVLDVCTGTGELAVLLLEKMSDGRFFYGVDFCNSMLELAKVKIRRDYPRATFHQCDAKDLPYEDDSYDVVTVSFGMRNIPDTTLALREIFRVLRPGGRFLCLELTRPTNKLFIPIYKVYTFRIMPWVANLIVKSSTPYAYLPRSIEAFYSPDEFVKIIAGCGFSEVVTHSLSMGVATIFQARKREQG